MDRRADTPPPWATSVTRTIPNYLRIHRDSEAAEAKARTESRDLLGEFWDAYSHATGWRVDQRARKTGELELLPAVALEDLDATQADSVDVVRKSNAQRLAASANALSDELRQSREAIRRQEIELAARASILAGEVGQQDLAQRIETTLADVVAACRCDAAAMYMLDDQTEYLKTSAVFGLPPDRLEMDARQLRDSRTDLEAMVQGVVTIDDLRAAPIDTWNCPEDFDAAICVLIESGDVPIGTLWLFRHGTAEFGIAETAAARMAAAKLSLELAHASISGSDVSVRREETPIRDVAQWQFESLPVGASLAPDWKVDGMIESPNPWATGWHQWDVLPDGTLMMAIAESVDGSVRGAMSAAIARAALAAHTGYRHTPAELMRRVSDTLWQTSIAEQLVSLMYVRVDPETGEGEVATAGSISAIVGNRFGYRPLVDGQTAPLNADIDASFVTESFRLERGETLLAYTAGLGRDGLTQSMMGESIRTAMQENDESPLAMVRRDFADVDLTHERGAVTLLRK